MSVFHDILRRYWGYGEFRPLQLDIIESVSSGHDTLGLMPTGGGKSVTFQVPSLAKEGICLVVTPLVALMRDQVERLKKMNIRAACIHSGLSQNEIVLQFDNCQYGNYKFLYVSPERLSSPLFKERIVGLPVSYLVIDEAHCISQWGYDFRPSYLNIAGIRVLLPGVPVLALTATATPEVVTDIQEKLHFPVPNVLRMSFERKNLAYVVRKTDDKEKSLLKMLEAVPGTALVYVRMRATAKEISDRLVRSGISSDYYHAGLTDDVKRLKQQSWQEGRTRVMVSTNAFGMGIDKADVRLVVHWDLPDSPESYFQEAGRAGRDGRKAYAVLLYRKEDAVRLKKRIPDTFPDKKYIRKVYDCLCYYYELEPGAGEGCVFAFDIFDFCKRFHLNEVQAFSALKIVQQAGYIELSDEQEGSSKVCMSVDRDSLYRISLDGDEEELLLTLLRTYSGLFADAVIIQEERLSSLLNIPREEVYRRLLKLSREGVIDYIPRKKSPLVRMVQGRVEGRELRLTDEVYDDRRRRYEERIRAMIDYAAGDTVCRSRFLLNYFGERASHGCGVCDVCLSKNELGVRRWEIDEIREAATRLIERDGPMPVEKLVDALASETLLSDGKRPTSRSDFSGGGEVAHRQVDDFTLRGVYSPQEVVMMLRYLCSKNLLRQENFRFQLPENGMRSK